MKFQVQTTINRSKQDVWQVITNMEAAAERISSIQSVEVLEKPSSGLVGLKWRETRIMFGKSATEVMWVTEAVENDYYKVRAESHGAIYNSVLKVSEEGEQSLLTMEFNGEAQTIVAKIMSFVMMPFFKGATLKALQKDLDDIKSWMEKNENSSV